LVNLYEILGLEKFADTEEVKDAYRKLVKKLHPDRNPDNPAAVDEFIKIQKAYDILGEEEKKNWYDFKLKEAARSRNSTSSPSPAQNHPPPQQKAQYRKRYIKHHRLTGTLAVTAIGFFLGMFILSQILGKEDLSENEDVIIHFKGDTFYTQNGLKFPAPLHADSTLDFDKVMYGSDEVLEGLENPNRP